MADAKPVFLDNRTAPPGAYPDEKPKAIAMSRPLAHHWPQRIQTIIEEPITAEHPLQGGCIAEVRRLETASGRTLVAKLGGPNLDVEAHMLDHLRTHSELPVPRVLHAEPDLLLIEHIEHRAGSGWGPHLAELLAALHSITSPEGRFGFDRPTLIGPITLHNPWSDSWPDFYREHRLLRLIDEAAARHNLPPELEQRIRRYADTIERELDHNPEPSLIHGDVWSGNVLASADRVVGLIDPSTQYADPEFELAFIALFSTGGKEFFDRYASIRPIPEPFFERRIHTYQLFPLLVHAALFGGGYIAQLDATLRRLER